MHADCWDCEVHTTYGWIECAGLADRSAFDLTAHGKASGKELVAWETFDEPKTMEVVEVVPNIKILGKDLKKAGKDVAEHLKSLPEDAAMALKVRYSHPETCCLKCICLIHIMCMYSSCTVFTQLQGVVVSTWPSISWCIPDSPACLMYRKRWRQEKRCL